MSAHRRPLGVATLLAISTLLALSVGAALAGGVGVIIPSATDGSATTAGQSRTLEFQVLQHGVSPYAGVVSVVLTDTATGTQQSVPAKPTGKPGTYSATVTFPTAGWWSWHVVTDGLVIESAPTVVGVLASSINENPIGFYPGQAAPTFTADTTQTEALAAQVSQLQKTVDGLRTDLAQARDASRDTMPLNVGIGLLLVAAAIGVLAGRALARTASSVRPIEAPATRSS